MSLFLEMLQAAGRAPRVLGESTDLVRSFLAQQQNKDGGFKDRSGRSDLYYTIFGLAGLAALEENPFAPAPQGGFAQALARSLPFVRQFRAGSDLDLVHLCCLARSWAVLAAGGLFLPDHAGTSGPLLKHLETHRSADGGYDPDKNNEFGTVYAAFLALGAYQDLHSALPQPQRLAASIRRQSLNDGSWMNVPRSSHGALSTTGSANATTAALSVLRHLGEPPPAASEAWLRARLHPQGGFLAAPTTPMPDLLSTATVLHALTGLGVPLDELRESCLDFVDTLWTNEGAFYGHWGDDHLDCEYTFYGLLALGHLALPGLPKL